MNPTALGALSVVIGAVAYSIYIAQTLRTEVEPHPISWFLWGWVTFVAWLVQHSEGGRAGSWVTFFTFVVCFLISGVTFRKYEWRIYALDKLVLVVGFIALGLYVLARNPTWAAILATTADVVGYYPTIIKGWNEPHKDSATSFALNGAKFLVAVFALGSYSLATWLYPITISIVNSGVAVMLLLRRKFVVTAAG